MFKLTSGEDDSFEYNDYIIPAPLWSSIRKVAEGLCLEDFTKKVIKAWPKYLKKKSVTITDILSKHIPDSVRDLMKPIFDFCS